MPAANCTHTVILTDEGTLSCCGRNSCGELGTSDNLERTSFTPIRSPVKFTSVSCGANCFTVACAEDGTLWAWGSSQNGQTGLPTNVNKPTKIPNTRNFLSVSSGCGHSVALDSSGFAWSFGDNSHGQLGLNHKSPTNVPTRISSLSEIQMISCGGYFTLLLDSNHRVWSCGDNLYTGNWDWKIIPSDNLYPRKFSHWKIFSSSPRDRVTSWFSRQVFSFGSNSQGQLGVETNEEFQSSPQPVPGLNDCLHIMCGGLFSVVHLSDRRVMVFGDNRKQQLGLQGEQSYYIEVPIENPDLLGKILSQEENIC